MRIHQICLTLEDSSDSQKALTGGDSYVSTLTWLLHLPLMKAGDLQVIGRQYL